MRSVALLCCVLGLGACARTSDTSARPAAFDGRGELGSDPVEALGDLWVGGFGEASEGGAFLRVDFSAGLARLSPRDDRAPLGIIHPRVDRDAVRFAIDDGVHRRQLLLRRAALDVLEGTAVDERRVTSRARLVRLESYEPGAVDAVARGTYAVPGDPHRLLFVDEGTLFDTRDGSVRRLYLRPERRALVGAGVATAHPSRGALTVDASRALHLEPEGAAALVAPPFDLKREELR